MRQFILYFFLLLTTVISAQDYSRVSVLLDENHTIEQLAQMGLDVEHGVYIKGKYITTDFSKEELSMIREAGFGMKVIIEDVEAHYIEQNWAGAAANFRNDHCEEEDPNNYETPEDFELGTMAGFYRYQEMLDELDAMVEKFPNLISVRAPIGNITTHEDRPIYWVRMSDNPNEDEAEPEVLYNALHHAREPNGLSALIFYMWYMLENYETDEEVQYLLNNTELYFIPCVNPDGYIYNETTNPDGGGFWRKNRRNNLDGTFGVDLNRNYGHEWAHDDTGSSPNTDSQTYRGPEAFSEPETQAVREFCIDREIQIALNYHTFGNLLIYPWGYSDSPTPEHTTFQNFARLMTRDNNYRFGTGTETVGYTVNGDSDDWMYGETSEKGKIYSLTPEAGPGTYGFWPPAFEIERICKENMWQNLMAARLVHNYGVANDLSDDFVNSIEGSFAFSLTKNGLKVGGLNVSINPISDNLIWASTAQNYGLLINETIESEFNYMLDPDIENGEEIIFELIVDNGLYAHKELITKVYNTSEPALVDMGGSIENWNINQAWGITTNDYYSAPSAYTDSPQGDYDANEFNTIELVDPIQFVDVQDAFLSFWAKWDIEADYDYTQVQLSVNGGPYVNLCGKYTVYGVDAQDLGEPLYEGTQSTWVQEEIHLADYINLADNPEIKIRFLFVSDGGVEQDGFYFDDFSIVVVENEVVSTISLEKEAFSFTAHPNPAKDQTKLTLSDKIDLNQNVQLTITNSLGQVVSEMPINSKSIVVDTKDWQAGIYVLQVRDENGQLMAKKLNVY